MQNCNSTCIRVAFWHMIEGIVKKRMEKWHKMMKTLVNE